MGLAAVAVLLRHRRVVVTGQSMEPALMAGDRLLIRRGRSARPGDVVLVRLPGRGEALKRLVGTPGDVADLPQGPRRLGAGEVALEGDQREASTDTRQLGPLPVGAMRGVALARYHPPGRVAGRSELRVPPQTAALAAQPGRGSGDATIVCIAEALGVASTRTLDV